MSGVAFVPESPPTRRRFWLRSLQSRLVFGVVGLVLVLVVAIGASTYFALRSFLATRLDQQLQSTISSASVENLFNGQTEYGPTPQIVWAVALDPVTGAEIRLPSDVGTGVRALHMSPSVRQKVAATHAIDPGTVETLDGQQLRITTRIGRIVAPGAPPEPAVFVIGLSTSEENHTLGRLISIEVVIGAAAVLIAFFVTSWGVRRSLRNLYAVTGTAREVAAELSPTGAGLDRRVPVVEEGTEVGQLAESMNTLLAAVETQFAARLESEHRMRQFLADASHELRTPLTSIRGYAELARMQRAARGDTESGADNLDRIESEGTRMSRLVDDLLLLARGDADDDAALTMHSELVDVTEVLDDAVSGSRAAFPDRPISLEVAPVPSVLGDRDQLTRVVRNLVNNAAVHTEPGRPIDVRASTEAGGAVIMVRAGRPG